MLATRPMVWLHAIFPMYFGSDPDHAGDYAPYIATTETCRNGSEMGRQRADACSTGPLLAPFRSIAACLLGIETDKGQTRAHPIPTFGVNSHYGPRLQRHCPVLGQNGSLPE